MPDYTNALDKVLERNARMLEKGIGITGVSSAIIFYENVKKLGSPWDYKTQSSWERYIDVPFPKNGSEFIWRGYVMNAADFGNINYGYTGRAVGFSSTILYATGGFQQSGFSSEVLKSPYYGDRPDDHCAVKLGIDAYDNR